MGSECRAVTDGLGLIASASSTLCKADAHTCNVATTTDHFHACCTAKCSSTGVTSCTAGTHGEVAYGTELITAKAETACATNPCTKDTNGKLTGAGNVAACCKKA